MELNVLITGSPTLKLIYPELFLNDAPEEATRSCACARAPKLKEQHKIVRKSSFFIPVVLDVIGKPCSSRYMITHNNGAMRDTLNKAS